MDDLELAAALRGGFGRVRHGNRQAVPINSPSDQARSARATRLLKAELAWADIGYRELAGLLKKHGLQETEASIANKISRSTFSATFLLASLVAIGKGNVSLEDV